MLHLSKVKKLDGIFSWSLVARETCPGAINADGQLVDACAGCYAAYGNYRFPNVINPRIENREDWQRVEWVDDMVSAMDNYRYFRWFDSGDCYSLSLAYKILEVMKRTPWVKHWIPTRMMKFEKFQNVLNEMDSLPNVKVRFSSDSIMGEFEPGLHGSTIIPTEDTMVEGVEICHAYKEENAGKCNGCRKCWDKEIPVIGYIAHGRVAKKNVRIQLKLVK